MVKFANLFIPETPTNFLSIKISSSNQLFPPQCCWLFMGECSIQLQATACIREVAQETWSCSTANRRKNFTANLNFQFQYDCLTSQFVRLNKVVVGSSSLRKIILAKEFSESNNGNFQSRRNDTEGTPRRV